MDRGTDAASSGWTTGVVVRGTPGGVISRSPRAKWGRRQSDCRLFGATLEVDDQTRIIVQGKEGSIADIHEGAKVKASYESRDGKNVAKSIDVMAGEASSPARPTSPGATSRGSSSSGSPAPAATPSTGQPKTP